MSNFFQKSPKAVVIIKIFIFIWIAICNLLAQIFSPQLESIGVATWSIFMVNILFFLMDDPNYKDRFIKCFGGVVIGLIGAGFLCIVSTVLAASGASRVVSVFIPLIIVLFVIIVFNSYIPYLFNNVAFAYFTIALINAAESYENLPKLIIAGILGNLIVNGGCVLLIKKLSESMAKKQ